MQRRLVAALVPGALAGVAGGVLMHAYLLVVGAFAHTLTPEQLYTYIASGLIGKAAYAWPGTTFLGVALHLLISVGWGVGYAYAALGTPQLLSRPTVSGVVFGASVYLAMQVVEQAAGIWHMPSSRDVFTQLVAHVVFFGLPVAYVVARRLAPT